MPKVQAEAGQSLAILADCNTGKTRVALTLAGFTLRDVRASVEAFGTSIEATTELQRARLFSFVPSDPRLLFAGVRKYLRGEFDIGRQFLGDLSSEGEAYIDRVIEAFDLRELLCRDPFTFSGGEAVRAAIALVLAKRPKILVLDQIFDALDSTWNGEVRRRMRELLDKDAIVVETHATRPHWFEEFDQCLVLGPDAHLYSPSSSNLEIDEKGGSDHPKLNFDKSELGGGAIAGSTLPVLTVEDLEYTYPIGGFHLGPVKMSVDRGEALALVGPNGSGKTTLLKCIALLHEPARGRIQVRHSDGRSLSPPPPRRLHEWARSIMYVFQNPDDQLYLPTVRSEIAQTIAGAGHDDIDTRCGLAARQLGLSDVLDISPLDLPRPQRRLVTIASSLAAAPPVLLLDEPTAFLDRRQIAMLQVALRAYLHSGGSLLLISHNHLFLAEIADRSATISETMSHFGNSPDYLS